ncbi:TetR family transcriptional regulator [Streptomyces fumanus]|uniref:TetR family regulatory protein n=1 Tax=Streptomyces fumanus TaxID=67302 RepID=A0A919A1M8_9ACTN|nr:TetR family transcriptional regulator [Streptomyces fumanus]GHE82367.1 putative TetR family regulatory protein [Streptomyces fumanus]
MGAAGNAEQTKARILEAALEEFSAYGIAGARVDRIARRVGCNKNLLYVYFGNKEALFTTVLERSLARVYEEIEFTPDDLPGYATAVFDFAMSHPDLMRLMLWSSLEQDPGRATARADARTGKVRALSSGTAGEADGSGFRGEFLLTSIMALATAWSSLSPFGPTLDPDAARDMDRLREDVGRAVARLAAPEPDREDR